MLTWYKPTDPGVKPENATPACCPPIVTVVANLVSISVADAAGTPVRLSPFTKPPPVKYTTKLPPAGTALLGPFSV